MIKTYGQIIQQNNEQAISLSQEALNQAGLEVGQRVSITATENKLIIQKVEMTLKERIHAYYRHGGTYQEKEIDFGNPFGREII